MQPKQPSGHTYRIFAEVKRGLPDIECIVITKRDRFTTEVLNVYQRKRQNVNKKFMTMSSFPLIYLDPHKRSKNELKKINPTVKSQKSPWKKCKIYIFYHKRRIIYLMHVNFSKETCLNV